MGDWALDCGALTVAMALVPGLYSRNKMFALFEEPMVRRARARSRLLRGVLRHLSSSRVEGFSVVGERGVHVVSYRLPAVSLRRRVDVSSLELSCLSLLCDRAGVRYLSVTDADRLAVEGALVLLPEGQRPSLER